MKWKHWIGNRKIAIPSGVSVELNENILTVKGTKGTLTQEINSLVEVKIECLRKIRKIND